MFQAPVWLAPNLFTHYQPTWRNVASTRLLGKQLLEIFNSVDKTLTKPFQQPNIKNIHANSGKNSNGPVVLKLQPSYEEFFFFTSTQAQINFGICASTPLWQSIVSRGDEVNNFTNHLLLISHFTISCSPVIPFLHFISFSKCVTQMSE